MKVRLEEEYIFERCKVISSSIKHINEINDLLEAVLSLNEKAVCIFAVIDTLACLSRRATNTAFSSFIDAKISIIVAILLNQMDSFADKHRLVQYLCRCFQLTCCKSQFISDHIKHSHFKTIFKYLTCPSIIQELANYFCSQIISNSTHHRIQLSIKFVLDLPSASQIGGNAVQDKNESKENKQNAVQSTYKKAFQRLLVALCMSKDQNKLTLYKKMGVKGVKVFSKMQNPLVLAQHFVEEFEQNIATRIEVLSVLFVLVGRYGLAFDNFYPRLEQMLQEGSALRGPNAARLFKLVEGAMRSSKVPLRRVLIVARILLRRAFFQSLQFSFWAVALIINLVKKHRKLLDHLKEWPQLASLSKHYSPRLRQLLQELNKDFNRTEYLDLTPFTQIHTLTLLQESISNAIGKIDDEVTWAI